MENNAKKAVTSTDIPVLGNRKISTINYLDTVELGYNVMKGSEYFVSLQKSVVITEEYNVMVNSEELIGITEYLTL
jgi:hypothetical protein